MSALAVKFRELVNLELPDLRETWQQYDGTAAPASMSRELLRLAVGYKMQEELSGGLSRRTLLQLSTIKIVSGTKGLSDVSGRVPAPRSGTKLVREWQGKVHEVLVLEDGQFAYGGKTYRSLTMIARQITGTHQSGPRFFGLKSTGSIDVAGRGQLAERAKTRRCAIYTRKSSEEGLDQAYNSLDAQRDACTV